MKCSLCKNEIDVQIFPDGSKWTQGHNAQPLNNGRCCTLCNDTKVIPTRIKKWYDGKGILELIDGKYYLNSKEMEQ